MFWFKHNTASMADGAIRIQPRLISWVVNLLKRSTTSSLVSPQPAFAQRRAESAQQRELESFVAGRQGNNFKSKYQLSEAA